MPRTHRVLVVDDEEGLRYLLSNALHRSGRFKVVGEADDGDTCLTVAERLQPDLIILDLKMPRVSGFQVLPELVRRCPGAKVVALSMLDRDLHERRVLDHGAAAFIDKGIDFEELVRRLGTIMGGGTKDDTNPPSGGESPGRIGLLPWLDRIFNPSRGGVGNGPRTVT